MKKRIGWWIAIAGFGCSGVCLAVVVGLVWTSGLGQVGRQALSFQQSVKIGATAPDFELPTLNGQQIRLSHLRGQPALVSFGATWCPDCQRELPILKRLHEQYPALAILSVDSREDEETVSGYIAYNEVKYPVVLDTQGKVADQYHIYAIPTVLFIDKSGVIQGLTLEVLTEATIEKSLKAIGINP
jgi:peroxiredoxin